MPREGLTKELKSDPFEFKMADLNESIKALTCGSLQIVDGFAGDETVAPGAGVMAPPGVSACAAGVWVAIINVEVGKISGVGVRGTGVEGNVHPASRTNPTQIVARVLVFIFFSSFDNYIPTRFHPTVQIRKY